MKFGFSVLQTRQPEIYSSGYIRYYDFVTIYDGSNDQSNQIDKLSGSLGSFSISSTAHCFTDGVKSAFIGVNGQHFGQFHALGGHFLLSFLVFKVWNHHWNVL